MAGAWEVPFSPSPDSAQPGWTVSGVRQFHTPRVRVEVVLFPLGPPEAAQLQAHKLTAVRLIKALGESQQSVGSLSSSIGAAPLVSSAGPEPSLSCASFHGCMLSYCFFLPGLAFTTAPNFTHTQLLPSPCLSFIMKRI